MLRNHEFEGVCISDTEQFSHQISMKNTNVLIKTFHKPFTSAQVCISDTTRPLMLHAQLAVSKLLSLKVHTLLVQNYKRKPEYPENLSVPLLDSNWKQIGLRRNSNKNVFYV